MQAVLSKLLFFIAAYLASKARKKHEKDLESIPILLSLSLVPLSTIVFLYILVYWAIYNSMDQIITMWFTIGTILLLVTNAIVFLIYELTRRTHIQFTQLQLEKQREKISAEYYELLLEKHESHKILIHDIKRHLKAIQKMATEAEAQDILQYTSTLCGEFGLSTVITYSGNKYVDVIINRYVHVCETYGFSFESDVRGVSMDFMEDMDITALLDNLLENAVEAVEQAKKKQITLSFYEQNDNFVVIKMQNSCDQPPRMKNGKILSSKKDGQAHGIGLKSIRRITAKYNGNVEWRYYDETATFEMVIVMNRVYGKAAAQPEKTSA
jgi:sensor histidine kinase YesM